MTTLLVIVWMTGLILALVWLVRLAQQARRARLVPRTVVALGALAVGLLGALAAQVWGTGPATRGMAWIADGRPQTADAEPPRARLFLRYVQMRLAPGAEARTRAEPGAGMAVIGYSPAAALRLPRSYGLDESRQGWDLLQVTAEGPQGLAAAAIEHPEPTATRVVVHAAARPDTHMPAPDELARHGDALVAEHGCGEAAPQERARLDGPGAIYAILCAGPTPRAALVLERDLAGSEGAVAVRVVPLVWRGKHWRPHHIQIASGSLIQIGTMADALPGVTLWEVPAPASRAELFYPPSDILAPCAEWLSGRRGEGFFSMSADARAAIAPRDAPPQADATDDRAVCVLPFTPPFGLEVRRLLPDVAGVRARSWWAAGLAVTPALLALLALAAQARSNISARRFSRLLTLGWLSVLWAGVSVWRLLWAHRIDMLRDYESVGGRVLANQIAVVLAGAALAATAAALWFSDAPAQTGRSRTPGRGLAAAVLGWMAWLTVGSVALRGDSTALPSITGLVGQALVSLAVGTAPLWLPALWRGLGALAQRLAQSLTRRARGAAGASASATEAGTTEAGAGTTGAGAMATGPGQKPWRWSWPWRVAALAAVAVAALLATVLAPRAVAVKLSLAWLFPFALYGALRSAVTTAGPALQRALATLVMGGIVLLALASFDPGVSLVIAAPGALLALLLASHDACFGEGGLRQLHGWQRQLAPLVTAHAAILGLAGLIVAVLCMRGLALAAGGEPDASAARTITRAAMHLVLFAALLFVPAAGLAYLRRGQRAAVPWLVATVILAGLWLARGPVVNRVLESSAQAAHRLAIVLDPGYALLHSENKFLAGLTAWRETVVPDAAGAGSATPTPEPTGDSATAKDSGDAGDAGPVSGHAAHPLLDGQGYFGAQLMDPGVLLSIENDYFPVLVLRETGMLGILATALLTWIATAGAWVLASTRFRHGSSAQRTRVLGAVLLAAVCLYQPLAALGALPLTGVAWPGFGLDSPSDLWMFLGLALWLLVWEPHEPLAEVDAREHERLESFDVELRHARAFTRVRAVTAAATVLVALAGMLVLARSAAFALRRPNPVDLAGHAVAPFDGLVRAVDYAYRLQCPWPQRTAPSVDATADADADANANAGAGVDAAEALVPADLLGEPEAPGVTRFHDALRATWREQRGLAVDVVRRFLDRTDDDACGGAGGDGAGSPAPAQRGAWHFERSPEAPDECRMRFKVGWPEVQLTVTRAPLPAAPGGDGEDGPSGIAAPAPGETEGDGAGGTGPDALDEPAASDEPAAPDADIDATDATDATDARASAPAHAARCDVELRTDVLRVLRFPARRPYRDARIRLVSRAMGAAALDRGELVSGHVSVRLRPGAGAIDVARARAGMYAGHEVRLAPELTIAIEENPDGGRAILRRTAPRAMAAPAGADADSWLFVRDPPEARVRVLAAEEGSWKLLPPEVIEVPLDHLTLIVVGGPDARSLWLFRPPQPWAPAGDAGANTPVADPLLADDITTVRGERRRHYLYGGLVPELGWVNPFHARMSLGLDGWVRVATAEYERTPDVHRGAGTAGNGTTGSGPEPGAGAAADLDPLVWLDDGREVPYCGTLDAPATPDPAGPTPEPAGATGDATGHASDAFDRVCRRSALDGVLECRVALQPELSVRLRHLTELVSLAPTRFGAADSAAPVHAGYVLMRGDTGEILAQGEFVPGRASSAYAPATPEIEQALIRLREDRDPATGRRLPAAERGEASAEKIEWGEPIAIGSTMKPLLARALELAAPEFAAALSLQGAPSVGALCKRTKTHALLGHCPPTDSLWNHHGRHDLTTFLSASVNWFQAAIGLLGTAVPGGAWGFGPEPGGPGGPGGPGSPESPAGDDPEAAPWPGDELGSAGNPAITNAGAHPPERALWTSYQGRRVITAEGSVDLGALRRTPMWQRFEELLGRPLCTLGSKRRCRRAHAQRDLCAARALPIDQPTRDLRHLVALGPSAFDFYPPAVAPDRPQGKRPNKSAGRVRTREYLQFLRGSGLHPLGSLAQSADAFNRLVYEQDQGRGQERGQPSGAVRGYDLAASWFPVPVAGAAPPWNCRDDAPGASVQGGLCEVLRTGTARFLRDLLDDARFTFHGAKTGTIDSLADVVENRTACGHFRTGHTVADRPARAQAQPYWLPCGKEQSPPDVNDSLLLLSLTVHTPAGDVPLTLGLRFQRSGPGFATRVARHYLAVIHAYFVPGATGEPGASDPEDAPDPAGAPGARQPGGASQAE